jgi:hypothetical protein
VKSSSLKEKRGMADEMSMALDDLLRKTQLSADMDPCPQVAMKLPASVSDRKSIPMPLPNSRHGQKAHADSLRRACISGDAP